MSLNRNPALPVGSWIYRNWRSHSAGAAEVFAEEVPLYSDARFTGEIRDGLGPYVVLNTIPEPHDPGTLVPAAVLRVSAHLDEGTDHIVAAFREGVPDSSSFTGGTTYEELASLLSLALRVRIGVGGSTRWFHVGDTDGRGSPRHPGTAPPTLPEGRYRRVIPELTRTTRLRPDLLETYPTIHWDSARELARAARSYRQAVWVANGDPNLAWLLLVAAAETAANEWARLNNLPQLSAADLLRAVRLDYAERLAVAAGDQQDAVLTEVGTTQATVLRAQWKFREFLLTYGVEAPSPRPKAFPIEWSGKNIKKISEVVYKYRSEALHASRTFPPPMSDPPYASEDEVGNRAWSERPGGASFQGGGLWTEDTLPINLHAFHHLVATALHGWWRELPLHMKAG